jgi:hypothetical protein
VVPWLALLGLLALKPNRRPAAWLIWLPVGAVSAVTLVSPIMPSGSVFLLDVMGAMAFGAGAVWLLPDYLKQSHRLLTTLAVLLAFGGFSLVALLAAHGLDFGNGESIQAGVTLVAGVLASVVALGLGGWLCRGRFPALGIYPGLAVLLGAVWLLMTLPIFGLAELTSQGRLPWGDFFLPVLGVAAGNFFMLLPFLILSSVCPFFGDRLKALLYVGVAPPTMPTLTQSKT